MSGGGERSLHGILTSKGYPKEAMGGETWILDLKLYSEGPRPEGHTQKRMLNRYL